MDTRLELKHLAPYLPYKLKCRLKCGKTQQLKTVVYDGICQQFDDGTFTLYWNADYGTTIASSYTKPILRPLSDLTKQVLINGENIVPIEGMFLQNGEREILNKWAEENKCLMGQQVSYLIYEKLFELHFDFFGLIEKGIAIDINALSLVDA